MIIIINLLIFLCILSFSILQRKHLIGALLIFFLSVFEIIENGMQHSTFLVLCELTVVLLIIKDTKLKKDDSLLLKYNPFFRKNRLPKSCQIIICTIFLVACIIRIASFFYPKGEYKDIQSQIRYQHDANVFINKIIYAYKTQNDYEAIAKSNPYTNDVFVCNVITLLVSEYKKIDILTNNIFSVSKLPKERQMNELLRLQKECLCEATNVVRRINYATFGESNAEKMSKEFSSYYMRLSKECSKRMPAR